MSLDSKTIEAIHRLTHEQKLSPRQIARELHVSPRYRPEVSEQSFAAENHSCSKVEQAGFVQAGYT